MRTSDNPARTREEMKTLVTDVAMKTFHTKGIRNVTMDDIAHSLSMSKRTLYQLFADKEELLLACTQRHFSEEEARFGELMAGCSNVLDFLLQLLDRKLKETESISPLFIQELRKYPSVVAYMKSRHEAQCEEGVAFLQRGVSEGIFRPEIDFRIVYQMFQFQFDFIVEKITMEHISPADLFANVTFVYLRGCTTAKGSEIMDSFMEKRRKA